MSRAHAIARSAATLLRQQQSHLVIMQVLMPCLLFIMFASHVCQLTSVHDMLALTVCQ
jgi:hypothetical protein